MRVTSHVIFVSLLLSFMLCKPAWSQILREGCSPYNYASVGDELKKKIAAKGYVGAEPLEYIRYVYRDAKKCNTDFSKLAFINAGGDPTNRQVLPFRAEARVEGYVIFVAHGPLYGTVRVAVAEKEGLKFKEKQLLSPGLYLFQRVLRFKKSNGFEIEVGLVERTD